MTVTKFHFAPADGEKMPLPCPICSGMMEQVQNDTGFVWWQHTDQRSCQLAFVQLWTEPQIKAWNDRIREMPHTLDAYSRLPGREVR
jgi:hypothetical protein